MDEDDPAKVLAPLLVQWQTTQVAVLALVAATMGEAVRPLTPAERAARFEAWEREGLRLTALLAASGDTPMQVHGDRAARILRGLLASLRAALEDDEGPLPP